MNCVSFPDMFNGSATKIEYDAEATKKCLYLLLNSESGEMFGDPDFGAKLRRYFYDQNNYILKDIIIDELYTKISIFCPQITLDRNNITLVQKNKNIVGNIRYRNNIDFIPDTYEIVLFRGD